MSGKIWLPKRRGSRQAQARTLQLGASYLAIIMIMSIGFSFVFYRVSTQALDKQLPPASFFARVEEKSGLVINRRTVNDFLQERISQGRSDLLGRLILLNLLTLAGGGLLSYYLARKSLAPIEEAMGAQSRFVSDASHELRTPLTAIRAKNEVYLRKPHLSTSEAKAVIESNLEEVIRLEALADGLLKLAREDPGGLQFEPVPLDEVISAAINAVLPAAQAKNMSVEDKLANVQAWGDRQSLVRLVTILLDNAIKYSPQDSTIYLEAEPKNSFAYLTVRDEGVGIRASDLPHIFDRFYRADSSRAFRDSAGYGLGLAIAQQVVEQHKGEIHVESRLGKGSTFTVKLPLAQS